MATILEESLYDTGRIVAALSMVAQAHNRQARKDKKTPYLAHLLAVTALVWEAGGTEDEAIAALFHDSVEDVGYLIGDIERNFGDNVARIVTGLTEQDKSLDKKARKIAYIEQIKRGDRSIKLVSLCDKLHNAESYLVGATTGVKDESQQNTSMTLWFYDQLIPVYQEEFGRDHVYVTRMSGIYSSLRGYWDVPKEFSLEELREIRKRWGTDEKSETGGK